MKGLTVLLASTIFSPAFAADIKYPVSGIPEELKKNVDVVVRDKEITFTIVSRRKASLHMHYAITILNSKGKEYASHAISYDKLRSIDGIKAAVYDGRGVLHKKLKSSEIEDHSAADGVSLFSDDRMKYMDLSQAFYPYTVEFEYELDYNFLYYINGSTVLSDERVSVEHFKYQLVFPPELKPRYKAYNIPTEPESGAGPNSMRSLTWDLKNVMPLKFEPHSDQFKVIQEIAAAPNDFEFSGYAGNMSTWEKLGSFQASLNTGRDVLPEATKRQVREMTAGIPDVEAKVKVLYEYLQGKTRYVGIQLGIGGWQPFDASVVDKTGYGDCKALSNYMVAILKEAGINGYYSTIRSGTSARAVDPLFPSVQSNHIIVAVPIKSDTIWLECTSQTAPFGYLGNFTGDRYAMMVTETGGKLVKTTAYDAEVNIQSTIGEVDVELTGNAKAKVKTTYAGLQYENNGLDAYLSMSAEDQKKWIQRSTDIPSFDVNAFKMTNRKDKLPSAVVEADLLLNRYAAVSGKRLFLTPNLMNRSTYIPEKLEQRRTNVVLKWGYTDYDTIRYNLPESIYPEFLPQPVKFESRFGSYESGFKLDQGKLSYYRKMHIRKGEFPPETYQELIDFYKSVNKADNVKLVFLSKT